MEIYSESDAYSIFPLLQSVVLRFVIVKAMYAKEMKSVIEALERAGLQVKQVKQVKDFSFTSNIKSYRNVNFCLLNARSIRNKSNSIREFLLDSSPNRDLAAR
jgi:hypothetical protein